MAGRIVNKEPAPHLKKQRSAKYKKPGDEPFGWYCKVCGVPYKNFKSQVLCERWHEGVF